MIRAAEGAAVALTLREQRAAVTAGIGEGADVAGAAAHHDHGHVEGIADDTPTVPGIVGHDVAVAGAAR